MLKDLRGFARDPKQWTQMAIMFGLLVIYVLNLRAMPVDLHQPGIKGLIAFLNLTVVSLILATFTSRFVYPLLSLESQQLWLLGLLPTHRVTLLLAKFLFALTVTGISAIVVMALAVNVLELPPAWARLHLLICLAICVGLCGLSVGLGARFPVFGQRNPARIASGFGGTFNLILSMLFVFLEMAGVALMSLGEAQQVMTLPDELRPGIVYMGGLLLLTALLVAAASLWVGARHFARLEA
jgi:ABC-2 type transport system permease protein